jgi:hypothetical protein
MVLQLRPARGGFLRPFGCGLFIKSYLLGSGPEGSTSIDPSTGAPQSDIFREYKFALIRATAMSRAIRTEEKRSKKQHRNIDPENIDKLFQLYLSRLPYKSKGCRYHSFVNYFSTIQKLGWVEKSGEVEPSEFQDNYPQGKPRIFYRLTPAGTAASDYLWANPRRALYG